MDPRLHFESIRPEHDAAMAAIIRSTLKAHRLDIPGTAYCDASLDRLSAYYDCPGRAYYVLLHGGKVVGGVGFAPFDETERCCEMQKLYLDDSMRGGGLGYEMVRFLERRAKEAGYRCIYLETHTNLPAAIHVYEQSGYVEIPRPASVIHTTMNKFYRKEL